LSHSLSSKILQDLSITLDHLFFTSFGFCNNNLHPYIQPGGPGLRIYVPQ
jgi:hypothetical protein